MISIYEMQVLAADCLDYITDFIKPGSTGEIDKICHDFQLENGAVPAHSIIKVSKVVYAC